MNVGIRAQAVAVPRFNSVGNTGSEFPGLADFQVSQFAGAGENVVGVPAAFVVDIKLGTRRKTDVR